MPVIIPLVVIAASTAASIWGLAWWGKSIEETEQKEIEMKEFMDNPIMAFLSRNMVWITVAIVGIIVGVIILTQLKRGGN